MNRDIEKIVAPALESLAERIRKNHEGAGQRASGKTSQSIRVKLAENGGQILSREYFGTTETGRKSGKVPKGIQSIILQWAKDKGISIAPIPYKRQPTDKWRPKYTPQERGYMSFAGAVSTSISKKGTRLHRNGGRNDIYSNEFKKTIQEVREELKHFYVVKIKNI